MSGDLLEFAKPRFDGDRFEGHLLPLEVLPALNAYGDLVLEVARRVVTDQEGSIKVPKGFNQAFELSLKTIGPGSAIPEILLRDSEWSSLVQQAREIVSDTIAAVNAGEELPGGFPLESLSQLEKIGKVLKGSETITFRSPPKRPSIYSLETLETLRQRQKKPTQKVTQVYAGVFGVDFDKKSIGMRLSSGRAVRGRFEPALENLVNIAVARRTWTRLRAEAEALVDSVDGVVGVTEILSGRTVSCSSHELVGPMLDRLNSFFESDAVRTEFGLPARGQRSWGERFLGGLMVENGVPKPHLYPAENGSLRCEWMHNGWDVSMEVSLAEEKAYLHALSLSTNEESDHEVGSAGVAASRAEIAAWLGKYLVLAPEREFAP
jgi:hypothetical protein